MSLPTNRNLFAEFKGSNRIMIETGSWRGDGIQVGLEAGYERVHSIDIDNEATNFCKNRFDLYRTPDPRIQLYTGDSAEILYDVINGIEHSMTFWLDSHWQMLEGTEPGKNPWPLLKELGQIMRHPVKTHTIIIDDILILTHPETTDWDLDLIKEYLQMINPAYKFHLVANPVINNILIATI
jgi:hypothetical protein